MSALEPTHEKSKDVGEVFGRSAARGREHCPTRLAEAGRGADMVAQMTDASPEAQGHTCRGQRWFEWSRCCCRDDQRHKCGGRRRLCCWHQLALRATHHPTMFRYPCQCLPHECHRLQATCTHCLTLAAALRLAGFPLLAPTLSVMACFASANATTRPAAARAAAAARGGHPHEAGRVWHTAAVQCTVYAVYRVQ